MPAIRALVHYRYQVSPHGLWFGTRAIRAQLLRCCTCMPFRRRKVGRQADCSRGMRCYAECGQCNPGMQGTAD